MSKIFEKLILQQLLKIAKASNVDLTGDSQHGFKEERSTVTAAADTGYQKSPLRSLPDYVQSETISTNLDNKS